MGFDIISFLIRSARYVPLLSFGGYLADPEEGIDRDINRRGGFFIAAARFTFHIIYAGVGYSAIAGVCGSNKTEETSAESTIQRIETGSTLVEKIFVEEDN